MKDQPKTRVVTFRLAEDEYVLLKTACGAEQTSISTVARRMVLEWRASLALRPRVDERLGDIASRLDTLVELLGKNGNGEKTLS